jgi:hypothetical protein
MALFDSLRATRDEKRAREHLEAHREVEEWQREIDLMQSTVDIIEEGGMARDHPDWDFPVQPQKGETLMRSFRTSL